MCVEVSGWCGWIVCVGHYHDIILIDRWNGHTVPINKKFPFRLRKTHRYRLNAFKKTLNERIALCKNATVFTHVQKNC